MDGYIAFIVVVVLLLAYYLWTQSSIERVTMGIIGGGLNSNLYTSGADLRFATEFTGTNQQPYSTPRIADVKAIAAALAANAADVAAAKPSDASGKPEAAAPMSTVVRAKTATQQSGGRERMESEPAHMYMCPCSKCPGARTAKNPNGMLNTGASDAAVTGLVEHLSGLGQSPTFWEISAELGKYRDDDRDAYFGLV